MNQPTNQDLLDSTPKMEAKLIGECEFDFYGFTRVIKIKAAQGPVRFEWVMADFQRETFQQLAKSIQQLRDGGNQNPEWQRVWIERTKKASKDADLALIVLWLILYPKRPFLIQIAADHSDQTKIVKKRIADIIQHNRWMSDYIELTEWEVRSKQKKADGKTPLAVCEFMPTNKEGAHGDTPDLMIINELTHIKDWEYVNVLKANADGVSNGMLMVVTNAGYQGTKALQWRQRADTSPDWITFILDRPAPWHNDKFLRDARLDEKTESRYNRLWRGEWVSGKGDAISESAIERIFRLTGPSYQPEPGWWYLMGMDLGIKHDHSAVAVLGVNLQERAIKVPLWKCWKPNPLIGKVNLQEIREWVAVQSGVWRINSVVYDPAQAELMAQDLERKVPMREMAFSGGNCNLMAETLIQVLENNRLVCYDDAEGTLRRDFGKLNIEERRYGFKLEATSDEFGHADVATAIIIALPAAVQYLNQYMSLQPNDQLYNCTEQVELTKQEIDTTPDELREILDMDYGADPRLFGNDYGIDLGSW